MMWRWILIGLGVGVTILVGATVLFDKIDTAWTAVVTGADEVDFPRELLTEPGLELRSSDEVDLIQYTADTVQLRTKTDEISFLTFSDSFYPGWRAWVNGREVKVYRTDGIIKGILLPGGQNDVNFKYDPISFKAGWLAALISLILTALLICPLARLMEIREKSDN